MTFFETVKNSVTVKQAAEHYGCKRMTDAEKKLLQAKHRMEEAQARDRVKERKARTRRLIQEGAILEKAMPEVRAMELSDLESYLLQKR